MDCFARHRRLLAATAQRDRVLGPHEQDWLDTALVAVAPVRLAEADARAAVLLVLGHVRTCVQYAPGQAGGAGSGTTAAAVRDQGFAFGLDVVLDGLERRVES